MNADETVEATGGLEYFENIQDLTANLDGAEVIRGFLAGLKSADA